MSSNRPPWADEVEELTREEYELLGALGAWVNMDFSGVDAKWNSRPASKSNALSWRDVDYMLDNYTVFFYRLKTEEDHA